MLLTFQKQKLFVYASALFLFIFATLLSVPSYAHAAALTIVTATTSSSNASTTVAKVGDTVSFGLNLSGTPFSTSTPVINIFNMGTSSMSGSGAWWSYSTTSASTWTNGYLSFYEAWGGSASGDATTTVTQSSLTGSNINFDGTAPTISSITSSAHCSDGTICLAGDTIVFTLTPGATEYGASVSGSYNGKSLTWSTGNGGATYTATYTVSNSDPTRTSALQISGVVITDAQGNASSAGSGSDVTVTISTGAGGGGTSSSVTYYMTPTGISLIPPVSAVLSTTTATTTVVSATSTVAIQSPQPPNTAGPHLSADQIQSVLSLLQAFGADQATIAKVQSALQGNTVSISNPSATILLTRDLHKGSIGNDVQSLQVFLNSHGFEVAKSGPGSPGMETTYFGNGTHAALSNFQKANNISPAAGFLGPKTRTLISSMH